jgi:hypothetical protein
VRSQRGICRRAFGNTGSTTGLRNEGQQETRTEIIARRVRGSALKKRLGRLGLWNEHGEADRQAPDEAVLHHGCLLTHAVRHAE